MPVFVGPGSAPDGGFEGKSDRVGFNTATSDPGSAVVGDMYVQNVGAGATLRLYNGTAWINAATTGSVSASGGNVDGTEADGSKYHIFTASGSFVVANGGPVSILAIAGGGGGGVQHGGGGGAGALYFNDSLSLDAGTYPITIGAGGGGGTTPSQDDSADGAATIFGPGTPQHIVVNGGGKGRKMRAPATTPMPGGPGGCGGGGGMCPFHPSPPSRTPGGTVTAPPTHSLPSPLIFGNVGGEGTDYASGPNGGTGGGGGGCGPDGGTGSNQVPDTNGTAPSGGDDYICPTDFLPASAIPTLGSGLGTPGKFLGVPNPQPDNFRRAFGGGGGGGSHSPWGIYNPGGNYPDGGGGSASRTGGLGGAGNTQAGGNGLDGRGSGGGGSGAGGEIGGDGGNGVIIIKYD